MLLKQHHLVFNVLHNIYTLNDIKAQLVFKPSAARFDHKPTAGTYSYMQLEVPYWERNQLVQLLPKKENAYIDYSSPYSDEFALLLNDAFNEDAKRYGYKNWYSQFEGTTPICYLMDDEEKVPELALPIHTHTSVPQENHDKEDNKQVDQLEQEASEHRYHLALQRASNQQSEAVENEDDEETQLEKKMNKAKLHPSVQPPIMPQPPLTPQPTKKSEKKHKNKDKGLAFGE